MPVEHDFAQEIYSRLLQVEHLEAGDLASLFHLSVSGKSARRRALLNTLHLYLLRVTVGRARRQCPYYRNHPAYAIFPETTPGQRPDLSSWPILDRSIIKEDLDGFLDSSLDPGIVSHTSGSTGEAFDIYRSRNEMDFLDAYFSHGLEELSTAGMPRPIALNFSNLFHGSLLPLPSYAFVLTAAVTDDTLLRDALRVLDKEYNVVGCENRVTSINGLAFHVLFFTSYLIEQGLDPKHFNIRSLGITGRYTSKHWRAFLRNAWGADVHDRISMTEVIGGATRLGDSNLFLVDPHVFPEVDSTTRPNSNGSVIGSLIYTNLYPFVQQQPLVRYRSGDLVRCLKRTPFMFEYLGRESNCVSYRHGAEQRWLLFSAPLNEILTPLPDIGMYDIFGAVTIVRDRSIGALPLAKARWQDSRVLRLEVELKYSPHLYVERVNYLRQHIESALRNVRDTCLNEDLNRGRIELQIEFLSPGGLGNEKTLKV